MPKKTEELLTTNEMVAAEAASERKVSASSILTISADADIETPESIEDTNWHELQNAYRTKKILTGVLKSWKTAAPLPLSTTKICVL